MSKHYIINMTPQPWRRVGINKRRFYDTQSQEKLIFGISLREQHTDPLWVTPIHLDITFFMPIPVKTKKKLVHHYARPDLDNLCKFILDAANGIIWDDDKVISKLSAQKIYDKVPRIEFTITSLE